LLSAFNESRCAEALVYHESFTRAGREELLRRTDDPGGCKIEFLERL
jgi:hypothetical protein